MKNSISYKLFFYLILCLNLGCTKSEFAANKELATEVAPARVQYTDTACSKKTLIKPKVDFLFLWDNSSSTNFLSEATKQALGGLIDKVSEEFDYRMLLAPLLGNGNNNVRLVSSTSTDLNAYAQSILINKNSASSVLSSFPTQQGNSEPGLNRAKELLQYNISQNIIRQEAYTFIVLLSNEDDNSWVSPSDAFPVEAKRLSLLETKNHEFLCMRGHYNPTSGKNCNGLPNINSLQLRFFSVGAHQPNCRANFKSNTTYRQFSQRLYSASYNDNRALPDDQNTRSTPDGYDICSTDFLHIFDGINDSIGAILIKHRYNFWPVANNSDPAFDPSTLRVYKNDIPLSRLSEPVPHGANGYTFQNVSYINQNTRFDPTPGEPFTGKMIKLYGSAVITYPECIRVEKLALTTYYGFVHLPSKPFEGSIQLTINGENIAQSASNGWQLLKDSSGGPLFINDKNITITSPTNRSPINPTDAQNIKSGYFLEVKGSAVYSNDSEVQVLYDPQS